MNNVVKIQNQEVMVKEYKGQRVVTFKDIDSVHERVEGTARRNFNTNKNHLVEGEDFFVRSKRRVWNSSTEWFDTPYRIRISHAREIFYRRFGVESTASAC